MTIADVFEGRARYAVEPCDALFGLSCLPPESVDAIVTDPPYGLSAPPDIRKVMLAWIAEEQYHVGGGGFMGKAWDAFVPGPEYWREAFRVLKPGGHLLCFAGTRTVDLMGMSLRFAGMEIRDCLCWLYGSGFPKSLDVAKQLDKQAGHWRGRAGAIESDNAAMGGPNYERTEKGGPITAAAAAAGYGTALKPAFEPCVLARKPLNGTVAANFQEHGTGALNIDGCRIGDEALINEPMGGPENSYGGYGATATATATAVVGRWPANLVLDQEAAALLDAQAGEHPGMSGGGVHRADYGGGMFGAIDCAANARNDSGGPSRFFYTAKASRSERDAGLDDFEPKSGAEATASKDGQARLESPRSGSGRNGGSRNIHPTVKPVDLMRWLVRLVGRPGALILDPFTGSGSTGVAAMLEGMRFVGLELEPLHVDFARARIAHVIGGTWEREVKPDKPVMKVQPSLFDGIGVAK